MNNRNSKSTEFAFTLIFLIILALILIVFNLYISTKEDSGYEKIQHSSYIQDI